MLEEFNVMQMELAPPVEGTRQCPACAFASSANEGAARHSRYVVRRCLNCHLLFSEPMQAAESAWYSSSWLYGLREENTKLDGRKRQVPWNFAQALSVLRPEDGNELLDVGCAEGHFLWLAQEAGFQVTGLDFNPHSLQIAKEVFGISSVYQSSVEELVRRFPHTTYNVVTIFEVLEHTADPFATLCSLNKILKPGGRLCLSVPGFMRWPALFHPVVDTPPHHLTLWTEEALKRLLERAGFKVVALRRKPLNVDDLGVHVKWRLQELVRRFQRGDCAEACEESASVAAPAKPIAKDGGRLVHRMGKASLAPMCWALRLNPRAGGFTLFVHGQKT
jgi:SAM-dependent methyltransferase